MLALRAARPGRHAAHARYRLVREEGHVQLSQRPEPPQFAPGGDAWLESTPPVLAPIQALAGLEFTLELGVDKIRSHNLAQKALLASLFRSTARARTTVRS